MTRLPTITLSSGVEVPALAYGTGTLWFKAPNSEVDYRVIDGIKAAIQIGYRHLDGAQMYNTERELGMAMKESGVPREDIFLTTKAEFIENVELELEDSLIRLQTNYVDLYLIHSPFSASCPGEIQSAWKMMERCIYRGLARSIGVSNFAIQHLDAVLQVATIKPAINQIEMHPYLQQHKLLRYMKENGISIEGFAPLTPLTKPFPGPVDAVCERLANKYGVSVSVIFLRWVIDQGAPVVTTSGKMDRLNQYWREIPSFQLTLEEVEEISQVSKDRHYRGFFSDEFRALETERVLSK